MAQQKMMNKSHYDLTNRKKIISNHNSFFTTKKNELEKKNK